MLRTVMNLEVDISAALLIRAGRWCPVFCREPSLLEVVRWLTDSEYRFDNSILTS